MLYIVSNVAVREYIYSSTFPLLAPRNASTLFMEYIEFDHIFLLQFVHQNLKYQNKEFNNEIIKYILAMHLEEMKYLMIDDLIEILLL